MDNILDNPIVTDYQRGLLSHWNHLIPVAILPDNCILVLDSGYDQHGNHFGPYILNRLGELKDVNQYYYPVFLAHYRR